MKKQEMNSHQSRLIISNTIPSKVNTVCSHLLQCFYVFTEEIFILLLNPLVHGHNVSIRLTCVS